MKLYLQLSPVVSGSIWLEGPCLGFLARSVGSKLASTVNHAVTHLFSKEHVADWITWDARDTIIAQMEMRDQIWMITISCIGLIQGSVALSEYWHNVNVLCNWQPVTWDLGSVLRTVQENRVSINMHEYLLVFHKSGVSTNICHNLWGLVSVSMGWWRGWTVQQMN